MAQKCHPALDLVTDLLVYWYFLFANRVNENPLGDFFKLVSPKAAKVAKQGDSGFAAFTGFDLSEPEKSQQQASSPSRPKSISVYGVNDVGS